MKTLTILVLVSSNLFSQNIREKVAVLDFEINGLNVENSSGFTNRIIMSLFETGQYIVIERSKIQELLEEQNSKNIGCTNSQCAVEIGKIIGVRKVILGNIDKTGDLFSVSARIVDVESGNILNFYSEDCNNCSIEDISTLLIPTIAMKIANKPLPKIKITDIKNAENQYNSSSKASKVLLIVGYSLLVAGTPLTIIGGAKSFDEITIPGSISTGLGLIVIPIGHIHLHKALKSKRIIKSYNK
jgi:TolB-like protein